jgi:adenylate cyclase
MANVARMVGQGNLDQQAIETSGGEIGELGQAINAMIRGLRQRNLLKETFGRYVAPSVVDTVLRQGNAELGGIKRQVTVFFSDLEGFTPLAESTPPETLVSLLNEYLDAMTKVILGSEGTLDKYIGDAIVAFWGEPVTHENDASIACRAALEQVEQLKILHTKWLAEGRPLLNMRIGIETGEVIVGNVGSDLKYNYTVLGDTVNFTSRLEGVNKYYGTRILIGENTRKLAGDTIEVREIDLLAVVGKRKSIHVYELVGMKGQISDAKRMGYSYYEQGLEAYREQDWDNAEELFKLAQLTLGEDRASEILLERIKRFRINDGMKLWDGSYALEHK